MQNSLVTNLDSVLEILSLIVAVFFAIYAIVTFIQTLVRSGPVIAFLRLFSFQVVIPFLFTAALFLVNLAVVFIQPTNVGVVVSIIAQDGIRPAPLGSGFHLVVPLLEDVIEYPIYWQTYTMSATFDEGEIYGDDSIRARTRDGQEVNLDVSVIYRVDRNQAVQLHINWQGRYTDDFVRPLLAGIVRQQTARFGVNEVNSSNRIELENAIAQLLLLDFEEQGLELQQFLLRDIGFTTDYADAVEQKQVAVELEEEARSIGIAAQNQARGEAEAIKIEAEAQEEALRNIGQALAENPSLLTYTYIERLSPNIRALLVPNDNPFILPLPDLLGDADDTTVDTDSDTTVGDIIGDGVDLSVTPIPTPSTSGD